MEVKPWRGRGENVAGELGKATAKAQKGVARLGQAKQITKGDKSKELMTILGFDHFEFYLGF